MTYARLRFGLLAVIAMSLFPTPSWSQAPTNDSLVRLITRTQSEVDALKKIKFSGYIQAQFQKADTMGIASFAGGNFEPMVNNRFMVRRGRLKTTYTGKGATAVLQVDVTEKGVAIKDAYFTLAKPGGKWLQLTMGCFNRPFGFEIAYSSSKRESPERARVTQSLFPGERDIGAMLSVVPPKSSALNMLRLDVGMFNGSGPTVVDFDSRKDVITRFSATSPSSNQKSKFSGGLSYYNGGVVQSTPFVARGITAMNGSLQGFIVDSNDAHIGKFAPRTYMGADAQVTVGKTTLRGEFIQGKQPGTSSSNVSPTKDPAAPTYMRNINGAYFYVVQTFLKKHQVILKYDWYDPNTDLAGDEIGVAGNTGKADIKFTTTGFGYAFLPDEKVKITIYYDIVKNETSANGGAFVRDLPDNVLTIRLQIKSP